jgi:hypothetical protein
VIPTPGFQKLGNSTDPEADVHRMLRWKTSGAGILLLGCVIGGFQIAGSLALLFPLLGMP